MNAGTTFVLANNQMAIDDHLWVVLSDTGKFPEQVVIVNFTTYAQEKDQACVINPGEHVWITHRSCIAYAHAKVVALTTLLKLKDAGSIVLQEPLDSKLLERVRQRSGDSITLPPDIIDILIEQQIICLTD